MTHFFQSILVAFLFLTLLVACSSPKERYVDDLVSFTEQVKTEHDCYTPHDREVVFEQYKIFREHREMYQREFTQNDLEIIDSCYQHLNVLLVKGYINDGAHKLDGYVKELRNLIDDLQE